MRSFTYPWNKNRDGTTTYMFEIHLSDQELINLMEMVRLATFYEYCDSERTEELKKQANTFFKSILNAERR